MKKIAIIGGGIIGLAVAHKLFESNRSMRLTVIEKENAVGLHQSGNNSGVLHCGLYYRPGSYKARLAVDGIRQMRRFCEDYSVPHEICGKLVLATNQAESERLQSLYQRGQQNGLSGLRLLGPEEILEREPFAAGVSGLVVPEEGIVDYPCVCRTLADLIREKGGEIRCNSPVVGLVPTAHGWIITSDDREEQFDYFVSCAGLYSDRLLQLSGESRSVRIVPFRGHYYHLKPERRSLVRHLLYPVPNPKFPFLGVHFSRMTDGNIEAGPNAVLAFAREGYRFRDVSPSDLWDALTYAGTWKFVASNIEMCLREMAISASRKAFGSALRKLVPSIEDGDLVAGNAGVRAQAMGADGRLVEDFVFAKRRASLHLLNAPSPGATASLAIADEILRQIDASV